MLVVTDYGVAKVTTIWMASGYECTAPNPERWVHAVRWAGVLLDGEYATRSIEGPPTDAYPVTVH